MIRANGSDKCEQAGEEVVARCRILVITYHYNHVKLGHCAAFSNAQLHSNNENFWR